MYIGVNVVRVVGHVRVRVSTTGTAAGASSNPALSLLARHHYGLTLRRFTLASHRPFAFRASSLPSFRSLITNVGPLARIRISQDTEALFPLNGFFTVKSHGDPSFFICLLSHETEPCIRLCMRALLERIPSVYKKKRFRA